MTELKDALSGDVLEKSDFEITGFSIRSGVTLMKVTLSFKDAGTFETDTNELGEMMDSFSEANLTALKSQMSDWNNRRRMTQERLHGFSM